jgi:hypothetical protein
MRSFSCVAGLRSASRLVVNRPDSESLNRVCVLVLLLCLLGMICPFTKLEKQKIFRFTSVSRLFWSLAVVSYLSLLAGKPASLRPGARNSFRDASPAPQVYPYTM